MEKKTYKIVTLGCRTNQYESQAYSDQLKKMGFVEASAGEKADICIVNTCTVTESADRKSIYQIRKLAKEYHPEKLIVTGCLAEREGDKISKIGNVTHVVPNSKKEELLQFAFPEEELPEFKIERFEAHTRAFVKIQDGCDSFCSYCIIPMVRGRSKSKTVPEIVKEIEDLVANGYKEVVLTGINIGDFDGASDPPIRLHQLIQKVDEIPGLHRIRVSSIDPDEVDDDLLHAIVHGKKTCQSMHIVLQAGSNLTLKRMRRKYTRQDFLYAINRLKKESPDFTFTTDVIVGFPGESEEEFQQTLDLIETVRFTKVHIFPYSDRPKTRASRMVDKIDPQVIMERKQRTSVLSERMGFCLRESYLNREMEVLLEGESKEHPGYITGHTGNFLPIIVPKQGLKPNDLIQVRCIENHPDGLIGEVK